MAQNRSIAREYLEALIIAAIFLQFANTFVIQTYYIPSGSMENTLLVGDHLFVNRFIYGPAPTELERKLLPLRPVQRGDIVVFRSKENSHIDIVKRCVGLPGDRIRVADKQLFINGKPVDDSSYAVHKDTITYPAQMAPRDNFPTLGDAFLVPPASYFCMGDNRDNSLDSRYWQELPATYLLGRAFAIYWSNGRQTSDSGDFGARIKDLAKTAAGLFINCPDDGDASGASPGGLGCTRWKRSFRVVR
jgi:signal peptidase I